jgi:hypothetical protein
MSDAQLVTKVSPLPVADTVVIFGAPQAGTPVTV